MVGRTFSHYQVLERLGEGGMGVVYKGEDLRLRRNVALKFLPRHTPIKQDFRRRFFHEAQAASALNHPNICTIYDIDEANDEVFIVMEYVDGVTLRRWMDRLHDGITAVSGNVMEEVLGILTQIADGLGKAHEHGIVHRDLKPENLMVTKDGRIKIMDFGLAKLLGASKLTRTGSTMGTVPYMSPEQIQGMPTDARSDIFSFGVLMYEMIAGRRPFVADHEAAVIYEIIHVEPRPLHEVVTGCDPEITGIVMKCLQKDRTQRIQSLSDVHLRLKRYSRGVPSPTIEVESLQELKPDSYTLFAVFAPGAPIQETVDSGLFDDQRQLLWSLSMKHGGAPLRDRVNVLEVRFLEALEAVRCAVEFQEALHKRNMNVSGGEGIQTAVAIVQGDDLDPGTPVEPGMVCLPEVVAQAVRGNVTYPVRRFLGRMLKSGGKRGACYRIDFPWLPRQSRWNLDWIRHESDGRPATGTTHLRRILTASGSLIVVILFLFALQPHLGSKEPRLGVSSEPPGCLVTVNGGNFGNTPIVDRLMTPGTIVLHVAKPGFVAADTTFEIRNGDVVHFTVTLRQAVIAEIPKADTVREREAGAEVHPIRSVENLADYLVHHLVSGTSGGPFTVAVSPFTFEETQIGSRLSRYLQEMMEGRLVQAGGWKVVQVARAGQWRPSIAGPSYVVTGTYWGGKGTLKFVARLKEVSEGRIVASAETIVPAAVIREARMEFLPQNFRQLERDRQALGKETTPSGDLKVDLFTNKGTRDLVFTSGDTMRVYLKANMPCYVRLVYRQADGKKRLLKDNERFDLNDVKMGYKEMGSWESTIPFGAELLQAFARTEAFEEARVQIEDGDKYLAEDLQSFVTRTRGMKSISTRASQAEARLVITTVQK